MLSLLTNSQQFLSESALSVVTSVFGTVLCLPSMDNVQHTGKISAAGVS